MGGYSLDRRTVLRSVSGAALGTGLSRLAGATQSSRLRWEVALDGDPNADPTVPELTADAGRLYVEYEETFAVYGDLHGRSPTRLWTASGVDRFVVDGDAVYLGRGSATERRNAASGQPAWTVDGATLQTVADDTVYVDAEWADGNGRTTHALDADTRERRWGLGKYDRLDQLTTDGPLVCGTDISTVRAIDARDGTERWATEPAGEDARVNAPALGEDHAFVRTENRVHALDRSSGEVVWTAGNGIQRPRPLTVLDGTLYVAGRRDPGTLVSMQPSGGGSGSDGGDSTGDSGDDTESETAPMAANRLYAFDAATGERRWGREVGQLPRAPVLEDGWLYAWSDPELHVLDPADGTERWAREPYSVSAPVLRGDQVYVGTGTGRFGCDDLDECTEGHVEALGPDGAATWRHPSARGAVRALAASGPSLFAVTEEGSLRAYDISEQPADPDLSLSVTGGRVEPGGTVTLAFTVENDGGPMTDAGSLGFRVAGGYPGEIDTLEITDHTASTGGWDAYAWSFGTLGRDERVTGTATLRVDDGASPGEYSVSATVGLPDDPRASDTGTIEVAAPPAPNRVLTRDDEPVAGAEVDAYVTDIRVAELDGSDLDERHVATATTDENGVFELPTDYHDADRELLVTARKGDWFTVDRYDPREIESPADYGWLKLDRQRLYGPTVARTDDGAGFGAVSVWRFLFSEDTHVFYIEVTNTNEYEGTDAWRITKGSTPPGGGPAGGDFLLLFPEDAASVTEDSAFTAADPTGEGGVHVLARGQEDQRSLPEVLHPLRQYTDVPLYAAMRNQPTEALREDWHVLTEASSERARQVSERLRKGLELPGKVCSKLAGVSCGPGFLLSVLDKLTYINKLVEGDRRVAEVEMTPNTPRVGGAVASGSFDVWKPDDPSLDNVPTESSVAYQVPVRVERDGPITYSVRTEWARPFNDLGSFSGTFTTGPVDAAIERPTGPLSADGSYYVDVRLRNRSLEPRTITDLTVETPDGTRELSPDEELAPGETTIVPVTGDDFEVAGGIETRLLVTATAADGTTVTRTARVPHEGAPDASAAATEPSATPSPTVADDRAATTSERDADGADGTEPTTGSGPGFGVLAALVAGGSALASRLSGDDSD